MKENDNWGVGGATVKGAKHKRKNQPNQDAIDWAIQGNNLVLAISDGHGSQKHFRSHIGAQLAVQTAVEITLDEVDVDDLTLDMIPEVKKRVQSKLPERIVKSWQKKVEAHYSKNIFSVSEQKKSAGNNTPFKAYGATLVVVLVAKHFALYLQLGDGDILVVKENEVERLFAVKEEEIGPATDSLCMVHPESYFKFSLRTFSEEEPVLVLAATDGYINSFGKDEDFLNLGREFLDLLNNQGIAYVENNLKDWLSATSREGSGDDITLGLVYSLQAINSRKKIFD